MNQSQSSWSRFWKRYGYYVLAAFVVFALVGSIAESWYFQQQQNAQQAYQGSLNNDWPPKNGYPAYVCANEQQLYPYHQKLTLKKGDYLVVTDQNCFDIPGAVKSNDVTHAVSTISQDSSTVLVTDRTITGIFSSRTAGVVPLVFHDLRNYCGWTRQDPFFWNSQTWLYKNEVEMYAFFIHGIIDTSVISYDSSPGLDQMAQKLQRTCEHLFPDPMVPQTVRCGKNGFFEVGINPANTDGDVLPRIEPNWVNYYALSDTDDPYALVITGLSRAALVCITLDTGQSLLLGPWNTPLNMLSGHSIGTLVFHGFSNYQVRIWTWQGMPQGYVVPWQWFNDCRYVSSEGFGSFETYLPRSDGDGANYNVHIC